MTQKIFLFIFEKKNFHRLFLSQKMYKIEQLPGEWQCNQFQHPKVFMKGFDIVVSFLGVMQLKQVYTWSLLKNIKKAVWSRKCKSRYGHWCNQTDTRTPVFTCSKMYGGEHTSYYYQNFERLLRYVEYSKIHKIYF